MVRKRALLPTADCRLLTEKMRITDRSLSETALAYLQLGRQRLQELQQKITSGREFTVPSQAPLDARAALQVRSVLAQNQQYRRNMEQARSLLQATDGALDNAGTIVQRLRSLAVAGATDTASSSERTAMAAEVEQILQHLVQIGNTRVGDRYIFSGFQTQTVPFNATTDASEAITGVAYRGDGNAMAVEVGPARTVTVNLPGDAVFSPLIGDAIRLRDDLKAGDTTALSADLTVIDGHLDRLLAQRALLGARSNALELMDQRNGEESLTMQELLSAREEIDLPQVISRLNQQEVAYQAALQVNARLLSATLLDFLR